MPNWDEDLRFIYPDLTADSVVIDLGCFKGDFAWRICEKYGCRVFAFEPVAHFFADCFARFKPKNAKIRVLNYAVGGENGTVHGIEHGDMSGLYAQDGGNWSAGMVTMDVALGLIAVPGADLLKINIEGSEFPLLEDMATKDLIRRFANLQIQWHDVVPDAQARFDALQLKLAETHVTTFDHGWVWQNWRLKE